MHEINFSTLNPRQRSAVDAVEGFVSVTSSAGSGKTHVLIHRIANMLNQGIPPSHILAFTFTNKAGEEMKVRLANTLGVAVSEELTVGTMHSIFYRILKEEYPLIDPHYTKMGVVHGWRQKKLFMEAFTAARVGQKSLFKNPNIAQSNVSRAKNECLSPRALLRYLQDNDMPEKSWIVPVYERYEALKRKDQLIDFDDMLLWTYQMFKEHPDIRERWQHRWEYILVDEFQDTNTVQFELIKMLSNYGNLFIVGDAKQAIYGFRGARVEYIQQFADIFPNTQKIELDLTYRCRQNIVDVSNFLAQKMKESPARSNKNGGIVEYLGHFGEEDEESEIVVQEIAQLVKKEGVQPQNIKVLYRTNVQSRALEECLNREQIPYVIIGGFSFFDRKDIKDMLSYLEILEYPHTAIEAFERVVNRPSRFLGQAFLRKWAEHRIACESSLDALLRPYSHSYMVEGAAKLYNQITKIQAERDAGRFNNVGDILLAIRAVTGYDKWLIEQEGESDADDMGILENLNEMVSVASRFEFVEKFLQYVEMMREGAKSKQAAEAVQLMTIHKAKGLEAPVVFVVGVSQGLLPHFRGEIDEERRLMYVAVTRAADRVYLSGHAYRNNLNQPMIPSIFLAEMELVESEEEIETPEEGSIHAVSAA